MATGTVKWYGLAPKALLAKEVDFLNDSIKGMLTTVTYVPDQDAHDYKSDVTNEVTGTNYTAGGLALANKTVTYTAGTNVGKIDADDLVWSNSTIVNARVLVIYDATPSTDATRPLLFYAIFDANVSTDNGALTATFDAAPYPCADRPGVVSWSARAARHPIRGTHFQGGLAAHGRCAPGPATPSGSATSLRSEM